LPNLDGEEIRPKGFKDRKKYEILSTENFRRREDTGVWHANANEADNQVIVDCGKMPPYL
jgi:hypothetical protein